MTGYSEIDSILLKWGSENSIKWYDNYQDVEVRTFYINESRRDRVQVAVDSPVDGGVLVRVGQNTRGLPRLNRVEVLNSNLKDLVITLDNALSIARAWSE
jgi:hypothetical protein